MGMNANHEISERWLDPLIKRIIAAAEREEALFTRLTQAVEAGDPSAVFDVAKELVNLRISKPETCAKLPR